MRITNEKKSTLFMPILFLYDSFPISLVALQDRERDWLVVVEEKKNVSFCKSFRFGLRDGTRLRNDLNVISSLSLSLGSINYTTYTYIPLHPIGYSRSIATLAVH